MKKNVKFLCVLSIFGLVVAGCSKEPAGNSVSQEGEKGSVQLIITSKAPTTRGSIGEENATAAEVKIDGTKGLKVYVFNEDGTLDYASPGVLTLTETPSNSNVFKSEAFEVTAGDKYFFVFANDPASGGKITAPTATTLVDDFLQQAVTTSGAGGALNIAQDNNFLLGTLWKEKKLAPAGGTSAAPMTVNLTIGRLSSKVNLNAIDYSTTNADLGGSFSGGKYRIGSLPYKINTVGVHAGIPIPAGNNDVFVTSYVHNTNAFVGTPPAVTFNTTDYIQYSNFQDVLGDGVSTFNSNSFYTTENTSARDAATTLLYFGNTSYIQLETTYTPVQAEVFNPETLVSNQPLGGATFWTAKIVNNPVTTEGQGIGAGKRIIITDPTSATLHADIIPGSLLEFADGKNYHKFAIFDSNESDDVNKFRVLRNHYYEFKVTNITDLGSYTSDVNPAEPVPTSTTVDVEVTVKNWDKVSANIEL
jgi:hypothetical protein